MFAMYCSVGLMLGSAPVVINLTCSTSLPPHFLPCIVSVLCQIVELLVEMLHLSQFRSMHVMKPLHDKTMKGD